MTISKKNIRQSIISVIVFFDMFDYPVSSEEIWKYSQIKCNQVDIDEKINNLIDEKVIEKKDDFLFLSGRAEIIEIKKRREKYYRRKLKRAKIVSWLLRLIPSVQLIALGNVIGQKNLRDGSDIDLFVITKKNKIWTTRFFCVLIVQLLGMRPKPDNTRDKICLSFFVSEDNCNLKNLMLKPDDPYFIYWLAGLVVIYEKNNTHHRFMSANNWVYNKFPNLFNKKFSNEYSSNLKNGQNWLEKLLKNKQMQIMPDNLKSLMNKDSRVIVNDKILKMHSNDRRKYYKDRYILKMQKLNIKSQNDR